MHSIAFYLSFLLGVSVQKIKVSSSMKQKINHFFNSKSRIYKEKRRETKINIYIYLLTARGPRVFTIFFFLILYMGKKNNRQ